MKKRITCPNCNAIFYAKVITNASYCGRCDTKIEFKEMEK